ncbi:MAG TPA: threonine synthase [Rhodanobacteraceae bacterium]|nr:threonine synthase [Rhodanobacteraceae bacterium]
MHYISTRQHAPAATLGEAITAGLAPDGGLYVPDAMPRVDPRTLSPDATLAELAVPLLTPFFDGDTLREALPAIAAEALDFAAPVQALPWADADLLELFHGPTAAFKDFGARFLAACLHHLRKPTDPPLTILVATSGDTGAAVAAAFHRVPGFRVCILYPEGRVSPRQAHQLGCFGDNVRALRVAGSFDQCQQMVKQALGDAKLQTRVPMSSANSISLGRLLPQMTYYAQTAMRHQREHGQPANFIIPTGNLGNALACTWVRALGLPVGRIHLAANANATLPEYFAGNAYRPREGIPTLANAMDIGAPSNFERLRWLYRNDDAVLRTAFTAGSTADNAIRRTIAATARDHDLVVCPHTATAMHELARLRAAGDRTRWTVVATAHPAKFDTVVEPLVARSVAVPPALDRLLQRRSHAESMPAESAALRHVLGSG